MSRSIRNRHNKYGVNLKISGNSDKKSKRIANRKFRRKETLEEKNTLINQEDEFITKDIKEVSNTWDFSSDGLAYYMKFNKKTKYRNEIPKEEQYKFRNK